MIKLAVVAFFLAGISYVLAEFGKFTLLTLNHSSISEGSVSTLVARLSSVSAL